MPQKIKIKNECHTIQYGRKIDEHNQISTFSIDYGILKLASTTAFYYPIPLLLKWNVCCARLFSRCILLSIPFFIDVLQFPCLVIHVLFAPCVFFFGPSVHTSHHLHSSIIFQCMNFILQPCLRAVHSKYSAELWKHLYIFICFQLLLLPEYSINVMPQLNIIVRVQFKMTA